MATTCVKAVLGVCALTTVAHAEGGLAKGPWIMDVRENTAVVMVERTVPGTVTVTAHAAGGDGGASVVAVDTASGALHEVRLTGLRAATRYGFTVTGEGLTEATGSFSTAPSGPVPFRFVIYGDTRGYPSVHRRLVEAIVREGPELVVHTGDLVSDGRDESLWQAFFDIEAPLLRRTFFAPVIGNHEIAIPGSQGIEQYRKYVHVSPPGFADELDHSFRWGGVRFVLANSFDDWTREARQWLETELSRARAEGPNDWLFVVTHWGPRSSGPHGDNSLMHDGDVDSLLRRYRVDLVISGHDHAYERGDDHGLRYIVSGGGGAPLYPRDARRGMTVKYAEEYHYVRVDVDTSRVRFTTLRPDGSAIDTALLTHDGWQSEHRAETVDGGGVDAGVTARVEHEPEQPEDFSWVKKALPVMVIFAGLTWWMRKRTQGH